MKKFQYKNICPHCGKENTLWPRFRGGKRFYVCDNLAFKGCGKIAKGITKEEWDRRKKKKIIMQDLKNTGMELTPKGQRSIKKWIKSKK